MTEKQIEQLIEFRKAVVGIRNNKQLIGEEYYNCLTNLNSRIQSAIIEYKPIGLSFSSARISQLYESMKLGHDVYIYNDEELDRCADVMLATIDGIIARIPNYDHICHVRDDIKRAKNTPAKRRKEVVVELVSKYSGIIKFDKTVLDFAKPEDPFSLKEDQSHAILQGVIGRLEIYLTSLSTEKKPKTSAAVKTTNINVSQTQNNNQVQITDVNLNLSIENCLKDLEDCESVSEEEISEIKAQMAEIQKLLENKRGNKKSIREKIKDALKWIAEKGTDVMIAVLPTVITILNNIK